VVNYPGKTTRESIALKLDRYLLNPFHENGKHKAKWFKTALGFTIQNRDLLAQQIKFDPDKAIFLRRCLHGWIYKQNIDIIGVTGKTIPITFEWIINRDGVIRLVTAKRFPKKR